MALREFESFPWPAAVLATGKISPHLATDLTYYYCRLLQLYFDLNLQSLLLGSKKKTYKVCVSEFSVGGNLVLKHTSYKNLVTIRFFFF